MAGLAPEGSQFDARQFDTKMNELLVFVHMLPSCLLCSIEKYLFSTTCVFSLYSLTIQINDYRLGAEGGEEFFTSYDEVYDSFDAMGLQENLLRGIYAYGTRTKTFK